MQLFIRNYGNLRLKADCISAFWTILEANTSKNPYLFLVDIDYVIKPFCIHTIFVRCILRTSARFFWNLCVLFVVSGKGSCSKFRCPRERRTLPAAVAERTWTTREKTEEAPWGKYLLFLGAHWRKLTVFSTPGPRGLDRCCQRESTAMRTSCTLQHRKSVTMFGYRQLQETFGKVIWDKNKNNVVHCMLCKRTLTVDVQLFSLRSIVYLTYIG